MKERPILFRGSMVRAILDGRKTQTRRVMKPQPENQLTHYVLLGGHFFRDEQLNLDEYPYGNYTPCPYGWAGDHLWVRETWQDYCPLWSGAWCGHGTTEGKAKEHLPVYRADDPSRWVREGGATPKKWRPSIFMPRWASRITLEVTGIRVERVQDISGVDILAEGFYLGAAWPEQSFPMTWDIINGKAYPWESNPWVWVVEFKKVAALEARISQSGEGGNGQ